MRSPSQGGTRPPWSGRSALPERAVRGGSRGTKREQSSVGRGWGEGGFGSGGAGGIRERRQGVGGFGSCTTHAQPMHNAYAKENSQELRRWPASEDRARYPTAPGSALRAEGGPSSLGRIGRSRALARELPGREAEALLGPGRRPERASAEAEGGAAGTVGRHPGVAAPADAKNVQPATSLTVLTDDIPDRIHVMFPLSVVVAAVGPVGNALALSTSPSAFFGRISLRPRSARKPSRTGP